MTVMTTKTLDLASVALDHSLLEAIDPLVQLRSCIQCGTCSATCPTAYAMDYSPRQLWRMVKVGMRDEVLSSHTFWLCSLCYQCQVRCPRGISLTETITRLKELALGTARWRESTVFYHAFANVMRRYGRMREMEFMARYLLGTNPLAALGYAKLGLTLLARGKVHPELPSLGKGRLDRLFERVAELEGQQ